MCQLKSGIILKNRVFVPEYDSHTEMLEELGIKDDYLNASKTFVRAELSPANGDVFSDIDTWKLTVDQDIIPKWYDEDIYKPQVVEAVKEWAKDHIHIGVDGLKIATGRNHYITRDAINYGYDFQSAMYTEGAEKCTGRKYAFVFIVIEKDPPYAVNVLQADDVFVKRGKDIFRELIGIYHNCKTTGDWYGYLGKYTAINSLSLPAWLAKEIE